MTSIDFSHKAVEMIGITKKFGDFVANHDIDLTVHKGEVHALLGENGAGKTTLMNMLYGLLKPTSGTIRIDGQSRNITDPNVAIRHGIGMVHQHFMLVQPFSVTQNIVLGKEPTGPFGILDMKKAADEVAQLSRQYGLTVDPAALNMILETYLKPSFSREFYLLRKNIYEHGDRLIRQYDIRPRDATIKAKALSGGNQQKVIIAREIANEPDLLVAAQPTRGLDVGAIEYVHQTLVAQRNSGRGVLLISFELEEVMHVSDRIAVVYAGRIVGLLDAEDADEKTIGLLMAGGRVGDV